MFALLQHACGRKERSACPYVVCGCKSHTHTHPQNHIKHLEHKHNPSLIYYHGRFVCKTRMITVTTQCKETNKRGKYMTLTEEGKIIHCDPSLTDKKQNDWKQKKRAVGQF